MYGLKPLNSRNVITSIEGYVRISKNPLYENPYYEDINSHYPKGYPIYKEIEEYIKSITKPLRLQIYGKVKNFPVRISQNAAWDLEQSWHFRENQIEMISYKPKK